MLLSMDWMMAGVSMGTRAGSTPSRCMLGNGGVLPSITGTAAAGFFWKTELFHRLLTTASSLLAAAGGMLSARPMLIDAGLFLTAFSCLSGACCCRAMTFTGVILCDASMACDVDAGLRLMAEEPSGLLVQTSGFCDPRCRPSCATRPGTRLTPDMAPRGSDIACSNLCRRQPSRDMSQWLSSADQGTLWCP